MPDNFSETAGLIRDMARQADDAPLLTQEISLPYQGISQDYIFLAKPTTQGRELAGALKPFQPDMLQVSNLTSFVEAYKAGVAGAPLEGLVIHIENYLNVSLKTMISNKWGQRDCFLKATHIPIDAFKFDTFYEDMAKFIIALQVAFLVTDELLYVIKIASNLKAGNTVQVSDDGFSQTVTLKTGEVSTGEVNVKPRIKLIPRRTFEEAAQVESEFLIRFQQTKEQTPSIALYNVDGQKWKNEMMGSIKTWLSKQITDVPILA